MARPRLKSLYGVCLILMSSVIGQACLKRAHAGPAFVQKPFALSGYKTGEDSGQLTVTARLPFLVSAVFGSDVAMPLAVANDQLKPGRQYQPSGTMWARLDLKKVSGIRWFSASQVSLRHDPKEDVSEFNLHMSRQFSVTKRIIVVFSDSYYMKDSFFDTEQTPADWGTSKKIGLAAGKLGSRIDATLSTSRDDAVWHAGISAHQRLPRGFSLTAEASDLQSNNPASLIKAQFSRRW